MSACKVINSRARRHGKTRKKGFWAGRDVRGAPLTINMLFLPPSAGLSVSHSVHQSFFTRSGFDASKRNTSKLKVQQGPCRLQFLKRGESGCTLLHLLIGLLSKTGQIQWDSERRHDSVIVGSFSVFTLLSCPLRPLWGSSTVYTQPAVSQNKENFMFKKDFNIIHDDTNVWIWRASPHYSMFNAQLWIPLRPIMMSLRACWIAWIVGVWRVLAPYEFPVSMQHPKVSELWVRLAAWQSHWFVY